MTFHPASSETSKPSLATAAAGMRLEQKVRVREYGPLLLRPIVPEDEPLMVEFHKALSEETIYKRYFQHMRLESRIKHERLLKICTNSDDSFALVAEFPGKKKLPRAILAVGRLSRTDDPLAADFALLVHDSAQGHGIGSAMMTKVVVLAGACGFQRMVGEVLVANHEMLYVCRQFGFKVHLLPDEGLMEISLDLIKPLSKKAKARE